MFHDAHASDELDGDAAENMRPASPASAPAPRSFDDWFSEDTVPSAKTKQSEPGHGTQEDTVPSAKAKQPEPGYGTQEVWLSGSASICVANGSKDCY